MLGDKIRELRQGQGWSLVELARRSGVSKLAILNIEIGRHANPKLLTLCKLADAFGVSVHDLIVCPNRQEAA